MSLDHWWWCYWQLLNPMNLQSLINWLQSYCSCGRGNPSWRGHPDVALLCECTHLWMHQQQRAGEHRKRKYCWLDDASVAQHYHMFLLIGTEKEFRSKPEEFHLPAAEYLWGGKRKTLGRGHVKLKAIHLPSLNFIGSAVDSTLTSLELVFSFCSSLLSFPPFTIDVR